MGLLLAKWHLDGWKAGSCASPNWLRMATDDPCPPVPNLCNGINHQSNSNISTSVPLDISRPCIPVPT